MSVDQESGTADWRALGTYVELTVRVAPLIRPAAEAAAGILAEFEACASRFRADSDLSRVNAAAGRQVLVHPLLAQAVIMAVEAARQTDGLVHPLLGDTLVALGYDRTFAELIEPTRPVVGTRPVDRDAWREIEVDPLGSVRIPAGTSLDLGSIGKAFIADVVADALYRRFGTPLIVSIGGDLAIAGGDEEHPWPVSVREHPADENGETILLGGGGLATSSRQVRRWSVAGVAAHHLIDPRTGLPARTPWRTVSATGPMAMAANVASTAAMVLGSEAVAWLVERGVDARLVDETGAVVRTGHWPEPLEVTGV